MDNVWQLREEFRAARGARRLRRLLSYLPSWQLLRLPCQHMRDVAGMLGIITMLTAVTGQATVGVTGSTHLA